MSESGRATDQRLNVITLWRLGGLSPWRLAVESVSGFARHNLDARSAQFAFYSIMALAPLLIVVIACVAQLPIHHDVIEDFLQAVDVGMPDNVAELLQRQITDIRANSTLGLITIGLVLLGIAGSRIFLTIGAGLDATYDVEERRRFWKAGGLSLLLTLGVSLLLLMAMVLLGVGDKVTDVVTNWIEIPWVHMISSAGVRWGVACGFMLIATSVIYWMVPSVRLPWCWLSPGSVFATAGWVAVTQGFRLYVENFARYNETYGTLGGVVVLMIWLYLTGAVLLMGGQINSVIHRAASRHHFS